MGNVAYIKHNENEVRYELYIDAELKAYSLEPHDEGKKELIELAVKHGYEVKED